jgi:hypothetical protein
MEPVTNKVLTGKNLCADVDDVGSAAVAAATNT